MPLDRRQFLGAAAAPALLNAQTGRPFRSVMCLIADDQSAIAGCYGNPVIRTPNMDRMAREGVRFTHAYATTPSCSASRSVILSGLHNHANGQFGHAHLPANFHTHPQVQSIPRILKAQGFRTGVVGKLHVQPADVYPWDYEQPANFGNRDVWDMGRKVREFLQQSDGRPFYLHVGFSDPHRAGGPGGFANHRDYPNVQAREYSPADVEVPDFLPDRPEVRAELAQYYQSIDRLDQGYGFCLDALEEAGRLDDTLVLCFSDHGMPFPGAKASPYDSGLHVPFLAMAPGQRRKGHTNDAMIGLADVAPTVIDWCGAQMPENYAFHGRSIAPLLEREDAGGRDEHFYSHTFHEIVNFFPWRGVRTRRYKYTKFLYPELEMPLPSDLWGSPTWQGVRSRQAKSVGLRRAQNMLRHAPEELYDIEADPMETTNLAGSSRHQGVLAELREKVTEFRHETGDPWLRYFDRIESPPQPLGSRSASL